GSEEGGGATSVAAVAPGIGPNLGAGAQAQRTAPGQPNPVEVEATSIPKPATTPRRGSPPASVLPETPLGPAAGWARLTPRGASTMDGVATVAYDDSGNAMLVVDVIGAQAGGYLVA